MKVRKIYMPLKTRVSMSFKHPEGVAAIGRGVTVHAVEMRFGNSGYEYLIDYGKGVKKWEKSDLLERHFEGFFEIEAQAIKKSPLSEDP